MMAFDHEFQNHLHDLMVSVSESLADSEARYKAELLWKARQSNNSAATTSAYMDAEIHRFQTRVGQTIDKYIEALSIWGMEITPAVEREMTDQFFMLTAGPNSIHFPPAIEGHQVQAVQGAFARERAKLANPLVRQGKIKLRELKMKNKRPNQATQHVTNFNAPVTNAYVDSTHIQVSMDDVTLQQVRAISEGHAELQSAATEIQNAQSHGASIVDKVQRWATLLTSVNGMVEKVHQHYPAIAACLRGYGIELP